MPGAVLDVLDQRLVAAGQLDDPAHDLDVLALVRAADVVGLARPAALEDGVDAAAEVLDVEPVAHLAAVAVDGQAVAVQRVEDAERDQLLGVLARAVVVGAAADHGLEAVGVRVGRHEQVAARLGRRVGRRGVERRALGERPLRDRAVDLVGRDLEVARHAALARGVEQHARADHVRAGEGVLVGDRAVDVRLGGEVDDRVACPRPARRPGRGPRSRRRPARPPSGQVLAPARVGELVEHGHVVLLLDEPDVGGADEAGGAGDEQPHTLHLRGTRRGPRCQVGSRSPRSLPSTE